MGYLDRAKQVRTQNLIRPEEQIAKEADKAKEASQTAQTPLEGPRNKSSLSNVGTTYFCGRGLQLHGNLFHSLMVWTGEWSELRLEHPGGVLLNAKPEHITDALERHLWGVVYDQTKTVFVTWGNVPHTALIGKRDLKTWTLPVPEQKAA